MEESMNYDLNIWDRLGYETEYAEEGWTITVCVIPSEGAQYGSGDFLTSLDLTKEESVALTLGVALADGGDYTPDSDFWIDLESFFVVYQNIPTRVEAFLRSLYDQKEENNELLSVWQELSARNG
jgi:hypothetical protein